ncbi:MAG: hypothetical protein LBQ62_05765, partial [Candidatus Accumulibacter sp.]|jgi:hypothetical protein|nr:hypothetical protein [Accumulibacter sp.]
LLGLAYARGIGSLFSIAGLLSACHKYCGLHWKSSLKYCYRPIIIAFLMYLVVSVVISGSDSIFIRLPAGIATGASFYIILVMFSWYISGKPEGLESTVVDKLRSLSGSA